MNRVSFFFGKTNDGIEIYQILVENEFLLSKEYDPSKISREEFLQKSCSELSNELSQKDNLYFTGQGFNGYMASKSDNLERIGELEKANAERFYKTLINKLQENKNVGIIGAN